MKWTASSVAAALVILYGAFAFWPTPPSRGPGLSSAVAQTPGTPGFGGQASAPQGESKKKKEASTKKTPVAGAQKIDAVSAVEQKLTEKREISVHETPLQDFLTYIATNVKVEFYVDEKALDDAGVSTEAPISINLKSIRTDDLLDLVLGQHKLTWVARDGYVLITTKEASEQVLETRIYNCRDLVGPVVSGYFMSSEGGGGYGGAGMPGDGMSMGGGMAGMMPGGMMPGGMMPGMGGMPGGMDAGMGMGSGSMSPGGGSPLPPIGTLTEVITMTVMPESWTVAGGPGSMASFHNGLLVVTHHPRAHRKVDQLLRMLREATKNQPGTVVRE